MNTGKIIALFIFTLGIQSIFSIPANAQAPTIQAKYTLTHKKRITRTVSEYSFKATLINGDEPIKLASATASSHSPNTTVIDADVSFDAAAAGERIESSDTFTIHHDRREAFGPESLSWNVSFESYKTLFQDDVNVNLVKWNNGGQFTVDDTEELVIPIAVTVSEDGNPITVRITQTIVPETGLTLSPIMDGYQSTYSKSDLDKHFQTVRASIAGDYTVTTMATIVETGDKSQRVAKYKVLNSGEPELTIPSPTIQFETVGHAFILRPNTITPIELGLGRPRGRDFKNITGVRIVDPNRNIDITLNGEGLGADKTEGDGIYDSDFINIDSSEMQIGDCYHFHAIVSTPKGDATSPVTQLCVSNLPATSFHVEEQYWIIDGFVRFAQNLISVKFMKDTAEAKMIDIAESIDGTIVGGIPLFNSYTIQLNELPPSEDAKTILRHKIHILNSYPEVLNAGLLPLGQQ